MTQTTHTHRRNRRSAFDSAAPGAGYSPESRETGGLPVVVQPLQRRQSNAVVRTGPAAMALLPREVSDQQFAHGLIRTDGYLPPPAPIDHSWLRAAAHLFSYGTGLSSRFIARAGIDGERALRHLGSILRTPQLEPGHRDAAVAQLLHAWFSAVELEAGPSAGAVA